MYKVYLTPILKMSNSLGTTTEKRFKSKIDAMTCAENLSGKHTTFHGIAAVWKQRGKSPIALFGC